MVRGSGGGTRRLSVKKCFTGKYTTPKIHTNLHPGPLERIFRILNIDDVISRYCTAQLANFAKVGWKIGMLIHWNLRKIVYWGARKCQKCQIFCGQQLSKKFLQSKLKEKYSRYSMCRDLVSLQKQYVWEQYHARTYCFCNYLPVTI